MMKKDIETPLYIEKMAFSCQGQASTTTDNTANALGHPKIYLNFGEAKELNCPYCGQKFIHEKAASPEERMFFKTS